MGKLTRVTQVLGTRASEDGQAALIGIVTADGKQLDLALSPTMVWPFASTAISATALYYPASNVGTNGPVALQQPGNVRVGLAPSVDKFTISFTVENNAALTFLIDRKTARNIVGALGAMLDKAPN